MQDVTVDVLETHDREANRIGPVRTARGENAMFFPIPRRMGDETRLRDQMQMEDHDDMAKAIQVLQSFRERIKDMYCGFCIQSSRSLPRHAQVAFER